MAYGHPLLKLSLSKLGWLVEAVPPWWCAASHRYIALYLHSINAPRLAAIQRMGWALKIWKGFFVHPQRAVPFWERCSMFCDSIWQWYPSAPCGAPVSAETHPVQLSSLQLFVKERVKHLAPACSHPLPQCIFWVIVLLWNLLIIYRYISVHLCQRGPSQRQCLAVTRERDWHPQFLWDFTVREQFPWKWDRLLLLSFAWAQCRPSPGTPCRRSTCRGRPAQKGRQLGDEQSSSTLPSVPGKMAFR